MAIRANIFERFQLGPETTEGIPVLPTRRPLGMQLAFDPQIDTEVIREVGNKSPVGMQVFKEHTEGAYQASFGFNELVIVLNSLFGKVTPVTPSTNGVWTLTNTATGGTATLKLGTFPATANVDLTAPTATTIKTAFEAVLGTGTTNVTGTGPFTVSFNGYLKRMNVALIVDNTLATGGTLVAATTPGTLARLWTFKPSNFDPDDCQSYTMAQGSSNEGARAAGAKFTGMSWEARPRQSIQMTGNILAQLYQQGYIVQNLVFNAGTTGGTFKVTYKTVEGPSITYAGSLTAATVKAAMEANSVIGVGNVEVVGANGGPFAVALIGDLWDDDAEGLLVTTAALTGGTSPGASFKFPLTGLALTNIKTVPVEARNVGVWLGTSLATMVQLSNCQGIRHDVAARFGPVFTLDDRIRSYSGTIEQAGDPTFTITVIQDSEADKLIQKLRRNEVVYGRVAAEQGQIEPGQKYMMEALFACNIREPKAAQVDGAESGTYLLQCIYDEGLDTYLQWNVQTPLTGL